MKYEYAILEGDQWSLKPQIAILAANRWRVVSSSSHVLKPNEYHAQTRIIIVMGRRIRLIDRLCRLFKKGASND